MDHPSDKPTKPVLRLVPPPAAPSDPPKAADGTSPATPKRPRSALGQLLSAYADAIDRDVQALLEL